MGWKLVGLAVLAAGLIFAVIPVRTQTASYDPRTGPSPARASFVDMLGSRYLTPGAALLAFLILAVAGFVGLKAFRGRR